MAASRPLRLSADHLFTDCSIGFRLFCAEERYISPFSMFASDLTETLVLEGDKDAANAA
jgi:hypothetical protein